MTVELLVSRRDFLSTIKDAKTLSNSFTFKDIECEYNMDKPALTMLTNRLKERVGNALSSVLADESFKSELVSKPSKTIRDVKLKASQVLEVAKFDKLKKSDLQYLGAFELAKHSSHHVLSSCSINGVYMATGHVDSTFKIWLMNPQFFDTTFSSSAQPKISTDEIRLSGLGSGTTANFKKKEMTSMKPDSSVLPLELVLVN